ncbi:hypothetical protein C2E23DRAFT_859610 [Lenzites betulinus]|nr:hypothetical protein C2E23DRAFT_859610 [Lenzites betulinus]
MENLTTHFYLFAKNPYITTVRNRRILAGYPDEDGGVKYTTTNKSAILGVVNTCYRNFSQLAHKHATYGIHFAIETEAPSCAVQLALLLAHLATDGGNAMATSRTPKLADLVYSITPSGVYGTAYFNGLRRTYKAVKATANIDSYFSRILSGTEMPISTLPDGSRALAQPQLVLDCYETTCLLLFFYMYFPPHAFPRGEAEGTCSDILTANILTPSRSAAVSHLALVFAIVPLFR